MNLRCGRWAWVGRALLGTCLVVLCHGSGLGQEVSQPQQVLLSASGASVAVDSRTGRVVSLRGGPGRKETAVSHPAGSDKPYGFVEVVDLPGKRTYGPLHASGQISDWQVGKVDGRNELSFTQQYKGAPFRIQQRFAETAAGIRWEASVSLLDGQQQDRSVQVCWMLPLPFGWQFWGPNDLVGHKTDGVTPYRYVYGHTDHNAYGTVIPLVGIWGRRDGLAVFSPPDVRKTQIIFDVYTQNICDPANGMIRRIEDLQMLRVAHHMVGLRPGRQLRLAVVLAGCKAGWRSVLGQYVAKYPELFNPVPAARKWEGLYGITTPPRLLRNRPGRIRSFTRLKEARTTCLEIHGHFLEYGVYVTPEVLADPQQEYECRPHPAGPVSLAGNRAVVRRLLDVGIGPFMYFYNVHADTETIERLFASDLMRGEDGEPLSHYHGEPALRAQPDSPFGRHLIEQMKLLLEAYPDAPGIFVDNFAIQKLDFAHDDGVSMAHNRRVYDLNRNHQDVGPICFDLAHQAGKVILVNKLATIESGAGADMVLLEGVNEAGLRMTALACANRALFPLNWVSWREPEKIEGCLQQLLIWGGSPGGELMRDLETLAAYRPLTDALIGKRWVFDEDPVSLPDGLDGQIFRIDPHAPHGGDVVVTAVNTSRSRQDQVFTKGLAVTVRLPEAGQLSRITWLGVEKSGEEPVVCDFERDGTQLTVQLPPVGAAGVLRLSRQLEG